MTATINMAADAVPHRIKSSTVLDLRWGMTLFGIDYDSPWAKMDGGLSGYSKFWPNNAWYTPYMKDMDKVFYPRLSVGS